MGVWYTPHDVLFIFYIVEAVYPRKKEVPKGFLEVVVGEAERQAQYKMVEQVVASGNLEQDLRQAIEVS